MRDSFGLRRQVFATPLFSLVIPRSVGRKRRREDLPPQSKASVKPNAGARALSRITHHVSRSLLPMLSHQLREECERFKLAPTLDWHCNDDGRPDELQCRNNFLAAMRE